ncbi:MAG: hypothetical protein MUC56_07470 [Thermoanaerobaculales bacterium]|jgi:hypothetical protein|nr:hypothetical protein [Thermoanaerobaculales bacterium]
MSRRKPSRRVDTEPSRRRRPRPDTPAEIQAAELSSPLFAEVWHTSSKMTWAQFVERWERRFHRPS